MTRPPTLPEAIERRLTVLNEQAIHTFSNGTAWDCWADSNCYECWHWDAETAGAACAFEAASFLHIASPDLARMFGWVQRTEQYGPQSGWQPPDQCAYFRPKRRDDGEENPPPPDPDPRQLVLIADPTEVIAGLVPEPVEIAVPA
jgi:hypothetical protein